MKSGVILKAVVALGIYGSIYSGQHRSSSPRPKRRVLQMMLRRPYKNRSSPGSVRDWTLLRRATWIFSEN